MVEVFNKNDFLERKLLKLLVFVDHGFKRNLIIIFRLVRRLV